VTNNVYGVDLLEESVMIARLRLKLAGLRALPTSAPEEDVVSIREARTLQWRIRQGNSLVGYTGLSERSSDSEEEMKQTTLPGGGWR